LSLQSVPASPFYGQTVSLIAVITVTNGGSIATNPPGSVQFQVGGQILGSANVVNSAATFALTGTQYQSGSVGVFLTYTPTPGSGYLGSTLSTTLTLAKAPSTLTLTAENNPAVLGQATYFQTIINVPSFGAIPTGSMTFTGTGGFSSTTVNLVPNSPVVGISIVIPNVGGSSAGSALAGTLPTTVTATYSGDANFIQSTVSVSVYVVPIPILGAVMNGVQLYQVPITDPSSAMTNNAIIATCRAANMNYTCIGAQSCCSPGTPTSAGYICDSGCRYVFPSCNTPFQDLTTQMCRSNNEINCFPINNIFMFAGTTQTSGGNGVGFEDTGNFISGGQVIGQYAMCAP